MNFIFPCIWSHPYYKYSMIISNETYQTHIEQNLDFCFIYEALLFSLLRWFYCSKLLSSYWAPFNWCSGWCGDTYLYISSFTAIYSTSSFSYSFNSSTVSGIKYSSYSRNLYTIPLPPPSLFLLLNTEFRLWKPELI